MNQKTAEALQMVGQLLAEQLGHPKGEPIEMTICLPKTACTICVEIYVDESGCDPCPNCGAGYSSQIFDDELMKIGLEYKTDKRYVPEQETIE